MSEQNQKLSAETSGSVLPVPPSESTGTAGSANKINIRLKQSAPDAPDAPDAPAPKLRLKTEPRSLTGKNLLIPGMVKCEKCGKPYEPSELFCPFCKSGNIKWNGFTPYEGRHVSSREAQYIPLIIITSILAVGTLLFFFVLNGIRSSNDNKAIKKEIEYANIRCAKYSPKELDHILSDQKLYCLSILEVRKELANFQVPSREAIKARYSHADENLINELYDIQVDARDALENVLKAKEAFNNDWIRKEKVLNYLFEQYGEGRAARLENSEAIYEDR